MWLDWFYTILRAEGGYITAECCVEFIYCSCGCCSMWCVDDMYFTCGRHVLYMWTSHNVNVDMYCLYECSCTVYVNFITVTYFVYVELHTFYIWMLACCICQYWYDIYIYFMNCMCVYECANVICSIYFRSRVLKF